MNCSYQDWLRLVNNCFNKTDIFSILWPTHDWLCTKYRLKFSEVTLQWITFHRLYIARDMWICESNGAAIHAVDKLTNWVNVTQLLLKRMSYKAHWSPLKIISKQSRHSRGQVASALQIRLAKFYWRNWIKIYSHGKQVPWRKLSQEIVAFDNSF